MDLKRRIIFYGVITIVFVLLQWFVFRIFRKYLKEKNLTSKFWNIISLYPFIIFSIPFLYLFVSKYFILPKIVYDIYSVPFYIFQSSILFISLYLLIGKLIKLPFSFLKYLLEKINPIKEKLKKIKSNKSVVKFDESRRAFIRTSTFVVSGLAFTGAGLGVIKKDDFVTKYREIIIPGLPEQIKGLRIVQINDIHSGPFMSIDQMKIYTQVVNDLYPDLILIPGDITNSLRVEVHPFIDAFKNLKSKYGVYTTLGNHDYFDNPDYIADKIQNGSPFKMLRNESEILNINGKNLLLLGVEDTQNSGARYSPELIKYLDDSLSTASQKASLIGFDYDETPKILLYHKPYFFPKILDKNIDLILSGHTHGGQIVLAKIGNLNFSLAAATSPYISGLYKEKNSQMYISDGLGTVGLPLRMNCPPEITVLTIV